MKLTNINGKAIFKLNFFERIKFLLFGKIPIKFVREYPLTGLDINSIKVSDKCDLVDYSLRFSDILVDKSINRDIKEREKNILPDEKEVMSSLWKEMKNTKKII